MANVSCSFSGGSFRTSIYGGTGSSGYNNGADMTIDHVYYDTGTGKYKVYYKATLYDGTGDKGRYSNTARYVSLDGQSVYWNTSSWSWSS